jgi:hypothetical protein
MHAYGNANTINGSFFFFFGIIENIIKKPQEIQSHLGIPQTRTNMSARKPKTLSPYDVEVTIYEFFFSN